jgi:threonine/homoserine/homoserine lactone efflux protein
MMSLELYLAFIAACVLLALIPGPSMALLVATGTTRGIGPGFMTLGGNIFGLSILVTAAVFGMAPMLALAADWFDLIRYAGAAYLIWMGFNYVRRGLNEPAEAVAAEKPSSHLFMQAVAVALSNPKVLLFLGAFFPQFIDPGFAMTPQLTILGIGFVVTLAFVDMLIMLMSGYARRWLLKKQRQTHIVSGVLIMGAGVGLAFARR